MKFKKNYLAMAVMSAALVACGSDSDSKKSNPSASLETDFAICNTAETICTLEGVIDQDYTLALNNTNGDEIQWRLRGPVRVGTGNATLDSAAKVQAAKDNGVTLTIEPGVHVRGFSDGTLIVTRGSKLMAEGTKTQPITFSSLQDDDFDGMGEWGGVIVQGFASHYGKNNAGVCHANGAFCNVQGEGGDVVGKFGGDDDADNSGVIKYVRIAEAGKVAGPDNEVNGLTLMGVGHETTVEYVQVHNNLDDAVEWFGGTVNAKYLVLTGNDDDDVDYDEGYKGNIQHVLVIKNQVAGAPQGNNDPRGIEANSDKSKNAHVSATDAVVANITIVGSQNGLTAGQPALKLRGEVNTVVAKAAMVYWAAGCAEVKESENNNVTIQDSLCDGTLVKGSDGDFTSTGVTALTEGTMLFDQYWAVTNAEAVANGIVTDLTPVNNGSDFVFDATSYIGAVKPNSTEADRWWAGWTLPGSVPSATAINAPQVAVLAE